MFVEVSSRASERNVDVDMEKIPRAKTTSGWLLSCAPSRHSRARPLPQTCSNSYVVLESQVSEHSSFSSHRSTNLLTST